MLLFYRMLRIVALKNTVKPCPEAHMDMILFEVFLKSIDLIPQQQILQRHYFRAANIGWELGVRFVRGRLLPAYKVAQVPKKLMSGGGGSDTFFFDLKIFASILQAHSRGTLSTSQTSDARY